MTAPAPLPRGLKLWLGLAVALPVLFALTAPWRVAGRDLDRLTPALAAAFTLCLLALVPAASRRALSGLLRDGIAPVSRRWLGIAALAAAAFLARVVFARYRSLELSSWDTILFFHQPIAATVSGRPLFCDYTGASYLGIHGSYVLFAFTPLYALAASPFWLLAAQAAALAAGAAACFLVARRILGDDLAAAFLAGALLLNGHTARAAQYGFHVEAFYPLAIFLLWLGLLARRPGLVAAGVLLAISVKEDSLLVLLGFAAVAALFHRRYRLAGAVAAAATASFLITSRLVVPHFAGGAADRPWYASYWSSWGLSLPQAALGMLRHPFALARALAHSGIPHLLEPLLFLPLAGPEGLVAALPQLLPYGAADYRPLRDFAIYYSLPVLPFLFVGAAYGLTRLARTLPRRRIGALLVMAVCALDGAGYTIPRANPAGGDIGPALAALGPRPVRIQDTLYPHAARRGRPPRARQGASPRSRRGRPPRPRGEPLPVHRRRDDGADPAPRRGPRARKERNAARAAPLFTAGLTPTQ